MAEAVLAAVVMVAVVAMIAMVVAVKKRIYGFSILMETDFHKKI